MTEQYNVLQEAIRLVNKALIVKREREIELMIAENDAIEFSGKWDRPLASDEGDNRLHSGDCKIYGRGMTSVICMRCRQHYYAERGHDCG